MPRASWKIKAVFVFALAVIGFSDVTGQEPPWPDASLMEVRTLSKLPPTLAARLGWRGKTDDLIADLAQNSSPNGPRQVQKWFLVGGLRDGRALIATEEKTSRSNETFHVQLFSAALDKWNPGGEWIVASRAHTLSELWNLLRSPQTATLTERWRKRLDRLERQRSIFRSDPGRWHNRLPLREFDINDIEIREIEAVVHDLTPGAIVNISGVAKGCPCENGPRCKAQVWLLVYLPSNTSSLELSLIDGHWSIGPVQRWHFELDELDRVKFESHDNFLAARERLIDRFPMCTAKSAAQ